MFESLLAVCESVAEGQGKATKRRGQARESFRRPSPSVFVVVFVVVILDDFGLMIEFLYQQTSNPVEATPTFSPSVDDYFGFVVERHVPFF